MEQNNVIKPDDVKNFIIQWNRKFPIDYWWRKKYNIAFNSQSHRNFCFIDMLIDFIEEYMLNKNTNEKQIETQYNPGYGDWLKRKELTQEDIDRAYDSIEI